MINRLEIVPIMIDIGNTAYIGKNFKKLSETNMAILENGLVNMKFNVASDTTGLKFLIYYLPIILNLIQMLSVLKYF